MDNLWVVDITGTQITLYKRVSGTYSSVQSLAASGVAAGDVMRVVGSGSTIEVYRNGTQIGTTVTDTFNATATKHGARVAGTTANSNSIRLDDLTVA